MAEVEWAMMCDYAFKDAGSKSCLIGIFDRIFTPAVPTTLNRASLAIKISGDPQERANLKLEMVRPTGGTLTTIQSDIVLGDNGAVEIQAALQGLPLPDWGVYGFNIYLGEVMSPKTITVTVVEPPKPAPRQ